MDSPASLVARPTSAPSAYSMLDVGARSLAEERLHRKQTIAIALRLFDGLGFSMSAAGHFTARDPERADHFWINPFAHHLGHLRASDLLLVNEAGAVVEGNGVVNQAGFAIHSALHKARPDVVGAVHLHSLYGKTWSSFGRPVQPLCQDSAAFFEDQAIFDAYHGVVEDVSEGEMIARALGTSNNAILKNHGLLTVAASVEGAAWRFLALETACQVQLIAESAGGGAPMDPEVARKTRSVIANERSCAFSFGPYRDKLVAEQPDVLQ